MDESSAIGVGFNYSVFKLPIQVLASQLPKSTDIYTGSHPSAVILRHTHTWLIERFGQGPEKNCRNRMEVFDREYTL